MSVIDDDKQWLKKIGIDSWRKLSKEKFMDFVAVLPEMSNKVRLEIIKQVPQFIKLTSDGLATAKESFTTMIKSNDETTKLIIEKIDLLRQDITKELNKKFISPKRREFLKQQLKELTDTYERLDQRNKEFFEKTFKHLLIGIAALLGLVITFVGGKIILSSSDD